MVWFLHLAYFFISTPLPLKCNSWLCNTNPSNPSRMVQCQVLPSALVSLRCTAVPGPLFLRVGRAARWWPRLCVPTVLPSVENGLAGRGLKARHWSVQGNRTMIMTDMYHRCEVMESHVCSAEIHKNENYPDQSPSLIVRSSKTKYRASSTFEKVKWTSWKKWLSSGGHCQESIRGKSSSYQKKSKTIHFNSMLMSPTCAMLISQRSAWNTLHIWLQHQSVC